MINNLIYYFGRYFNRKIQFS